MSWNAEKERELCALVDLDDKTQVRLRVLSSERSACYGSLKKLACVTGHFCSGMTMVENAAEIVALLSPMLEAKPDLVADLSDPHAALRASYRPGQKWEFQFMASEWRDSKNLGGQWVEPNWDKSKLYRLKEDQS